jgi:hypothetical protein
MPTDDQAEIKPQRLRVVIQTHELQVTSSSGKLLQAAGCRLAEPHNNRMYQAEDISTCSITIDRQCSKYRIVTPQCTLSASSVKRTDGDADSSIQPPLETE